MGNSYPGPRRRSPQVTFVAAAIVIGAVTMGIGIVWGQIPWLWAYLLGINVSTIVLYAYDKSVAGTSAIRVPERVLILVAAAGGSIAAILGTELLRHKVSSRKRAFRIQLSIVVLVHVALFTLYQLQA
ncbi:DUF1294 domain-containing protein [bacterium]|nr:DUF1294 domain-containing protein [bacterium]